MPVAPRDLSTKDLVDMILFTSTAGRRELQSSPILGDVWLKFAEDPSEAVELLITPQYGIPAGPLARTISRRVLKPEQRSREKSSRPPAQPPGNDPRVAYLQGLIAARLTFSQLVDVILPMTKWWKDRQEERSKEKDAADAFDAAEHASLMLIVDFLLKWTNAKTETARLEAMKDLARTPEFLRMLVLGVLIRWVEEKPAKPAKAGSSESSSVLIRQLGSKSAETELKQRATRALEKLCPQGPPKPEREGDASDHTEYQLDRKLPWVFQVSLNREVSPALRESVPAVKGDAARHLFDVRCDKIVWAILDSGIDGRHPAFYTKPPDDKHGGKCRIIKALDFGYIREILNIDSEWIDDDAVEQRVNTILERRGVKPEDEEAWKKQTREQLWQLIEDSKNDRPLLWQVVESLIEVNPRTDPPDTDHGTHVAGILAANAEGVRNIKSTSQEGDKESCDPSDLVPQILTKELQGLCPEIELYDLRVLGRTMAETEFAVIAALQYIRHLNERLGFRRIHGANLSLQMQHNVRNWACGQTPVCIECENLINSGVVVVAAAGNHGYQRLQTETGLYDGYVPLSITDPGNADGVITVGATHRFWPHTYGVSFFSSRGPTGDGRIKPDLVAPGERITSCLKLVNEREPRSGEMDGTSMAAPHVSGAAAMLLARYTELQGRPRVVKEVLCSTATDLGRERSFQGHGMLDILRAFQKR